MVLWQRGGPKNILRHRHPSGQAEGHKKGVQRVYSHQPPLRGRGMGFLKPPFGDSERFLFKDSSAAEREAPVSP